MNPQQDALIRQAADLEHTTVTAFVLDSVTARAAQVVRRHQDLVLANEDFDRFICRARQAGHSCRRTNDAIRPPPQAARDVNPMGFG